MLSSILFRIIFFLYLFVFFVTKAEIIQMHYGVSNFIEDKNYQLDFLKKNTEKKDVIEIIGPPSFKEKKNSTIEKWYYVKIIKDSNLFLGKKKSQTIVTIEFNKDIVNKVKINDSLEKNIFLPTQTSLKKIKYGYVKHLFRKIYIKEKRG